MLTFSPESFWTFKTMDLHVLAGSCRLPSRNSSNVPVFWLLAVVTTKFSQSQLSLPSHELRLVLCFYNYNITAVLIWTAVLKLKGWNVRTDVIFSGQVLSLKLSILMELLFSPWCSDILSVEVPDYTTVHEGIRLHAAKRI